jgi:hypothetical protein
MLKRVANSDLDRKDIEALLSVCGNVPLLWDELVYEYCLETF